MIELCSLNPSNLDRTRSKFRTLLYNDFKDTVETMGVSVRLFAFCQLDADSPEVHRRPRRGSPCEVQPSFRRDLAGLSTALPRHPLQPRKKQTAAGWFAVRRSVWSSRCGDVHWRNDERRPEERGDNSLPLPCSVQRSSRRCSRPIKRTGTKPIWWIRSQEVLR